MGCCVCGALETVASRCIVCAGQYCPACARTGLTRRTSGFKCRSCVGQGSQEWLRITSSAGKPRADECVIA
eukprot:m.222305 g.222305  ORF g.222305 m.222305 type:complete len:71 (+) comp10737_c0_seq1:1101-1313(+)